MSVDSENLDTEWRERIQSSPDVKDARNNLQVHRTKVKEMHDELVSLRIVAAKNLQELCKCFFQRIAEVYETELEKRLDSVKERLKPPLMRFMEKLKIPSGVDRKLAGYTIREVEDSSRIVQAVKERANIMDQLSRSELVGFLQTILHLRDSFLEEDIHAGIDVMQV